MRKLLILAVLATVTGCQGTGMFASRPKDRERSSRAPDPLLSPDLEEQQRWGRARYSYPDEDPKIAPATYSERPTPSGR
ncbi:MAG TPA: hypothetical protein VKE40_01180 [Gemmataceae bacterium]|nr:hypothetical protein [Gemmataceae bacterium]